MKPFLFSVFTLHLLLFSSCGNSAAEGINDSATMDSVAAVPDTIIHPTFERFIVKGCVILDSCFGYLNYDTIQDAAILLQDTTVGFGDPAQRPLIVMLGGKNLYISSLRNDSVVLKEDEGGVYGDPFAGISIDSGLLHIVHYGGSAWRWSREAVFGFDTSASELILKSDIVSSFNINDKNLKTETEKRNPETFGKMKLSEYSVYR
jgi:hypothetical protein